MGRGLIDSSSVRAEELCESRGGRPGRIPVPNNPYGFCGRKATLSLNCQPSSFQLRSRVRVRVEVAVLALMASRVDVTEAPWKETEEEEDGVLFRQCRDLKSRPHAVTESSSELATSRATAGVRGVNRSVAGAPLWINSRSADAGCTATTQLIS